MSYEIIEDITRADIAFRVKGSDLADLFISASEAVLSVLLSNPESVIYKNEKTIELNNTGIDLLFFDFLQELIFFKDAESLLLLPKQISINKSNNVFFLKCVLHGEYIDSTRHKFNLDIKAVTMYKLMVEEKDGVWTALFVLDV